MITPDEEEIEPPHPSGKHWQVSGLAETQFGPHIKLCIVHPEVVPPDEEDELDNKGTAQAPLPPKQLIVFPHPASPENATQHGDSLSGQ